jgi:hypothetical protein
MRGRRDEEPDGFYTTTELLYVWSGNNLNKSMFGDDNGSAPIYKEVKDGTVNIIEVWVCENHPPGSEISVPVGEACSVCGRTE